MTRIALAALLTVALAVTVSAQPQHGDLVVTTGSVSPTLVRGHTAYLNPGSPGTLTTLSTHGLGHWVRMAADNSDLVVSEMLNFPARNYLLHVHRGGGNTRRATLGTWVCDGFELGGSGWVGCARIITTLTARQNFLFRATRGTLAITPISSSTLSVYFNEMAIDRDPTFAGMPYVLATAGATGSTVQPVLMRTDGNGRFMTILSTGNSPLQNLRAVEVDPRTGDYLVLETTRGLLRYNKAGTLIATLMANRSASALKITQNGHVWVAANAPNQLIEYDLTTNTWIRTLAYPGPRSPGLQGIEVYGSQALVCDKVSASTVNVTVKTWSSLVLPTTQYALAASFSRRPGILFPKTAGQSLDLDWTDPLFLPSAQGLWPWIFQGFRGTLAGGKGFATAAATIAIPQPLQGSNIPVFVAGVLYNNNSSGVLLVTNTHWFVM